MHAPTRIKKNLVISKPLKNARYVGYACSIYLFIYFYNCLHVVHDNKNSPSPPVSFSWARWWQRISSVVIRAMICMMRRRWNTRSSRSSKARRCKSSSRIFPRPWWEPFLFCRRTRGDKEFWEQPWWKVESSSELFLTSFASQMSQYVFCCWSANLVSTFLCW